MKIDNWAQLTNKEQNHVMVVLASVFASIGTTDIDAAEWYDSGYISLIRESNGCRIVAPERPSSNNTIELASIEYEEFK